MRSGCSVGLSRSRGVAADPVEGKSATRFAVGFFVAIFLLLGGLYAAGYALSSDRVPRQVSVSGVDIGGLRPGQAQARLRSRLAPRAHQPIVVAYGDQTYRVDPAKAGLRLDVAGTVREAGGGRSLNPLRMIEVLTGGEDIDPVVDVDGAALDAVVGGLADQVGQAPVEGAVRFTNGRPVPVYPTPGLTLDEQATRGALQQAFLQEDPTFDLPVRQVRTDVSAKDVDAAIERFAEPAMSAPVAVHVAGGTARLSPRRTGAALSMQARHGRLAPVFDREALAGAAAAPLDPLTQDPKPATVVLDKGRPTIVKGEAGTYVPPRWRCRPSRCHRRSASTMPASSASTRSSRVSRRTSRTRATATPTSAGPPSSSTGRCSSPATPSASTEPWASAPPRTAS
jgi:hypothetical protein